MENKGCSITTIESVQSLSAKTGMVYATDYSIWHEHMGHPSDTTVKQLCMNLHFFRSLVSAMNIILGHYNLIILLELMV